MISEQETLLRCARALQSLRYLSEVPAKNLAPQPRSPGHEGHPPPDHRDSLSWGLRRLLRACEELEAEARKIKVKQKVKTETVDQFRARLILAYAGQPSDVVAMKENVKPEYVEKIRAVARCDKKTGIRKAAPRREPLTKSTERKTTGY